MFVDMIKSLVKPTNKLVNLKENNEENVTNNKATLKCQIYIHIRYHREDLEQKYNN